MSFRCFVEDLGNLDSQPDKGIVELCDQESRHARLSRRLSAGDELVVFDGQGREAPATITVASRNTVEVAVGPVSRHPRPTPALTLAVAMPKGPRQDFLIEKCTELGVAAIQPLLTERSVAGASDHKRDKWRRATIEAAKQSGQCWLPELLAPLPLDRFLQGLDKFDLAAAAILPRAGSARPFHDLLRAGSAPSTIVAFIGPEGGWSPAEAEALIAAGATAVSLGPNVLRIETAAISLAAAVHVYQGIC